MSVLSQPFVRPKSRSLKKNHSATSENRRLSRVSQISVAHPRWRPTHCSRLRRDMRYSRSTSRRTSGRGQWPSRTPLMTSRSLGRWSLLSASRPSKLLHMLSKMPTTSPRVSPPCSDACLSRRGLCKACACINSPDIMFSDRMRDRGSHVSSTRGYSHIFAFIFSFTQVS